MKKRKRIILVGHAASGKDYLCDKFIEKGYEKDISATTRQPRDNETPGETYHYTTDEDFNRRVLNNEFYEHVEFNGWKYGTLRKSWEQSDIFIMTPSGVGHITPQERSECIIVYIEIPEEIRRQRLELRSDADTTERRLKADEKDLKGFIDYDYRINDPNFDAASWIEILGSELTAGNIYRI